MERVGRDSHYFRAAEDARDDAYLLGAKRTQEEVEADAEDYREAENNMSAEIAMNEVRQAIKNGLPLDESFIEKTAEAVHAGWLKRNQRWADEESKKPYGELSESEKEKDRAFVLRAIEIFQREK